MPTNFDQPIDRTGTYSTKWDYCMKIFGKEDLLPMWVADMDFPTAPAVAQAIRERASHGVFGYTLPPSQLFTNISNWFEKRHNWSIEKKWLAYVPGVMPAINYAIHEFTEPGDDIIIQPPVYPPFAQSIQNNERIVVENPLTLTNGRYSMDFADLKNKIGPKTKMLLLCNPHNPVGRVWTRQELETLGEICAANDIVIISDEIHLDIVYSGHRHVPIASLSDELARTTITLASPGKTFNLQGLQVGFAIVADPSLRRRFHNQLERNWVHLYHPLNIEATLAAYAEGEDWLEDLMAYLEGNRDFLIDYIQTNIPHIDVIIPEGTYICWLDCRQLGLDQKQLSEFITHKAQVGLNDGLSFGTGGEGFQRINFACPRSTLEEGLKRIQDAVEHAAF